MMPFKELSHNQKFPVRFRFPEGINGPVVCQAHNDHFVGLSGSSFRTDVGSYLFVIGQHVDDNASLRLMEMPTEDPLSLTEAAASSSKLALRS